MRQTKANGEKLTQFGRDLIFEMGILLISTRGEVPFFMVERMVRFVGDMIVAIDEVPEMPKFSYWRGMLIMNWYLVSGRKVAIKIGEDGRIHHALDMGGWRYSSRSKTIAALAGHYQAHKPA